MILFLIIGIIINYALASYIASKSAEKGMGMGLLLIACFIPWLVVVIGIVGFIIDKLGKLWNMLK